MKILSLWILFGILYFRCTLHLILWLVICVAMNMGEDQYKNVPNQTIPVILSLWLPPHIWGCSMPPPLPTRPQARDLHCLSFIASCNNQPSVTYSQHLTVYSTMKSVFITEGLKSLNAEFQAASPEASDAGKVGNSARRQSKGRKRILGHFRTLLALLLI